MDPTGCRASQIIDTDHSNVVILDLPKYLKRTATSPSASTPTTSNNTDSFSSNSSGCSSISTYQIKYEQSLQKLQEMKCSDEQALDIFEILSALEEYNTKTESIIQYLQQQLIEVKAERDAAYKSFAKGKHKHRKEIEGWQNKVHEMGNKYEEIERELQEKNDGHSSSEESWMSKVNELECELDDKNTLIKILELRCKGHNAKECVDEDEDNVIVAEDIELDKTSSVNVQYIKRRRASVTESVDSRETTSDYDEIRDLMKNIWPSSCSSGDYIEQVDNTNDDDSIGTMSAISSREEQCQQRGGVSEPQDSSSSSSCISSSSISQTTDSHPFNSTDSQLKELQHEHEATKLKFNEMEKLNTELIEKIGILSDENLLLTQKQEESSSETIAQLETIEEETESLIIIEELEEENLVLRQVKEENEQLVGRLNQQIGRFLEAHEDTIAKYEEELAGFVEELDASNEKLSVELRELKEEHEILIAAMKDEDINCDNYYEEMLIELKAEKAEANRAREMLQDKISHLLVVSKE